VNDGAVGLARRDEAEVGEVENAIARVAAPAAPEHGIMAALRISAGEMP